MLERNATLKDVAELLGSDKHLTISSGASAFTMYDAEWLSSGAKYEDFDLEDLTITEDLHCREDVSEEQTFKIGGLNLRPIQGDKVKLVKTTTNVGLYQISKGMHEWADDLYHRLLSRREPGKPLPRDVVLSEIQKDPEWVNDDTGLIERCLIETRDLHQRSARVILVSADKRLANQMSNTCNVQVERLSPPSYIVAMRALSLDPINDREKAIEFLSPRVARRERSDPITALYVDTGSVSHYLSNLEEEITDEGEKKTFLRQTVRSSAEGGNRSTTYTLRQLPKDRGTLVTVPVRPTLRDRKFPHRQSRRDSGRSFGSSSHKSR